MIVKSKFSIFVFSLIAFIFFMMIHISTDMAISSVELSDVISVEITDEICNGSSFTTVVNFSFTGAVAQSSDPEECDEDCCTGCSNCFGWSGSCHNMNDNWYCGAIEPAGGGGWEYCYREQF